MIRQLYLDPDHELRRELAPEEMAQAVETGLGCLWVDIDEDSDEARRLLVDVFHAHPLAIDDCFNGRVDTPKVDDYGDYLFIVSQDVAYSSAEEKLELAEVDIFLGPSYVVTSHAGPLAQLDELFDKACLNTHLVNRGADMLAQTVLDMLVDRLLPAVEEIDDQLDALEQKVVENPKRELLPEVLLLKRHTIRLRRAILPQRDVVNRLSRGEFAGLIRPESLMFFRDVYDHTVRIEEILEGSRDVADSVLNTYLSAVNNRMNEVMKTLSVVTAIFLPLTLIASIFGTNLDYSPFGWTQHSGFFLMLGGMLVLVVAMVLYFKKRGWF